MATTSGNLAADTATGGRDGGRWGRFGLRATLAAGVATLGCVVALAFGGGQAKQTAPVQPQAAPATAGALAGTDDFTTECIGSVGPFACATALPVVTYGTDDLSTVCIGSAGPFGCAAAPPVDDRNGPDDEYLEH